MLSDEVLGRRVINAELKSGFPDRRTLIHYKTDQFSSLFRQHLKVTSFLLILETAVKVFAAGIFLLARLVIILRVSAAFELSHFVYALTVSKSAGFSLQNMLQFKATYLNITRRFHL